MTSVYFHIQPAPLLVKWIDPCNSFPKPSHEICQFLQDHYETLHLIQLFCYNCYLSWEFSVVAVALWGDQRIDPSPAPRRNRDSFAYNCWKMSPQLITSDLYYCKGNLNKKSGVDECIFNEAHAY